jgi:predicted MFS family arabinose efflux permease
VQRTAPPELLGRINGITRTAAATATVAGAALGGISAHHLGLHAPFLLGLPILAGAMAMVVASRRTFAA